MKRLFPRISLANFKISHFADARREFARLIFPHFEYSNFALARGKFARLTFSRFVFPIQMFSICATLLATNNFAHAQDLSSAPSTPPTSAISATPGENPTAESSATPTIPNPQSTIPTPANSVSSDATPSATISPSATPAIPPTPDATPKVKIDEPKIAATDANENAFSIEKLLDASVPTSLKIKDLSDGWQQININSSSTELARAYRKLDMELTVDYLLSDALGTREGTYFTQWQSVTRGNDSFLVVYRTQSFDKEEIENLFPANKKTPPTVSQFMAVMPKWMGERPLVLSLINLKTVKIVDGAQLFDLQKQIARVRIWANKNLIVAPPKSQPKIPFSATQASDLRELSSAIFLYAQDNDGVIPPMNDVLAFKKAVVSYLKNDALSRPETKPFYTLNPILSGKKTTHISAPKDMVTIYETQIAKDGTRGVAFLDGTTRRLSAADWTKYKIGSKIK